MSIPNPKPVKKKMLNPKLLPIAALVLVILALLFMATPLLRATGNLPRAGTFVIQNGQANPQNGLPAAGSRVSGTGRPFARLGGGALNGATGAIIYFIALIIALVAAVGMFTVKRWGQVLGIILAVLYGLVGLLSLLPVLLLSALGIRNPLSLILGSFHILLAIAVIVLAAIPAVKVVSPAEAAPTPTVSA